MPIDPTGVCTQEEFEEAMEICLEASSKAEKMDLPMPDQNLKDDDATRQMIKIFRDNGFICYQSELN